jgi:hypothetical protein
MGGAAHWDAAYAKGEDSRSWFQAEPASSLRLIAQAGTDPAAPLLDAGGGASRLVDALLARGFTDLTVADIPPFALEHAETERHRTPSGMEQHFVWTLLRREG